MQDDKQRAQIDRYFELTAEILPKLAAERNWAASEDSHFQRLVLDHVAGGVWYGRIKEPAILNLSKTQLRKALRLCEGLADGSVDFDELNGQSLAWREEKGLRLPEAASSIEEADEAAPERPSAQILSFVKPSGAGTR